MTATLTPTDAPAWSDWVTNFDGVAQSFSDNYSALVGLRPWVAANHPGELATVDGLISDAQGHIATLQKLKATRDYVVSWLGWLQNGWNSGIDFLETNASAVYNAARSWLGLGQISGLGIAPIIVAVSVGAAAAALIVISYWIQRAYREAQRLNALMAQEQLGKTPAEAAAIVDGVLGPAGGGDGDNMLGIPWKYIITGAVLIVVAPRVLQLIDDRRKHAA